MTPARMENGTGPEKLERLDPRTGRKQRFTA